MRAYPSVLLASTLIVLAGCLGPAAVAVVNETNESFYLRVEGQWVWEIPARSSGVANTGLEGGRSRVEILHPDCSSANAWGVNLPVTVTIRDPEVSEASAPAIASGISVSGELVATETCAGALGWVVGR